MWSYWFKFDDHCESNVLIIRIELNAIVKGKSMKHEMNK